MQFREQIFELLFSTSDGVVNGQNHHDIRNTNFFKILRANPSLAIFYADFLGRHGAKPSRLKDLGIESGIFLIRINPPKISNPRNLQPQKPRKVQTQWQSAPTHAFVRTSRSTESAAARPPSAEKFSATSTSV